jgi:hypothetical protein
MRTSCRQQLVQLLAAGYLVVATGAYVLPFVLVAAYLAGLD